MKEKQKLSELSLEALQAKQKQLVGVVAGLGIVMAIALVVIIYAAVKNKNYALLALAFALPVTLMPVLIYAGQLRTEIKARSSK
jgi:formate/nitrite transporter FocA (FNT family)